MNYLTGYTIKPYEITGTGEVLFTDGTNNSIRANQVQCGAYGYTYDPATGTCRSFTYNTDLIKTFWNTSNKLNGVQNTTQIGTTNAQINGTNNATLGSNDNCFISGSDNTIANGISNATVVGSNGLASRDGEFVVGSNAGENSTFTLNGTTTDATATSLFVDGDTAVTTIAREADKVYYFTIDVFAYRTGGSGSGSVGDRAFLKVNGMVSDTTITQTTGSIVGLGTTVGWTAACAISGTDLLLKVTGKAAMNITWQSTARFNKLTV
tara:strand:+ start:7147 stop:7944 length:798 start_codon:yes stop_codon:yes gene_type:complete